MTDATQLYFTGPSGVKRPMTWRAFFRFYRLLLVWWFARCAMWLADPDHWHIHGRRQDGAPVVCEKCGHVGRRMDTLKAYRAGYDNDADEPVDLCPKCGGEV